MAIRVAVTGRTATPPLFDTLVALGRDRTLERLDRAIASLIDGAATTPLTRVRIIALQMARTILVVEDEPTLRETLAEALETDGFRVVTAADGREALTRFRADRPDLVLLDLMLPELSGVEVCRIIRAESACRSSC